MVVQAPFGHDRTATADNSGHAVYRHRHHVQADTGMDGEVIHALLGLLDQCVAEQLPGQIFGNAIALF